MIELGAHVFQKFCIGWNLFDHIKQWNVNLELPQHFQDAFFLRSRLFASQCLGKKEMGGGGVCLLSSNLLE